MARYSMKERDQALTETRQRLLEAAIVEFACRGYAEANINHISEAAGFAKGTVYNYFPGKQSLMLAIIDSVGKRHLAYISEKVLAEVDAFRRLEAFFEAGFDFVSAHPAEGRILIGNLYGTDTQFKEPMYQAYLPMFKLVSDDILTYGIDRGCFRPLDAVRTATYLMTIYLGTSSQVDDNGKVWLDPRQVADYVLNGLRGMN